MLLLEATGSDRTRLALGEPSPNEPLGDGTTVVAVDVTLRPDVPDPEAAPEVSSREESGVLTCRGFQPSGPSSGPIPAN